MDFCEGDMVVAPGCGVGHIEEIAGVNLGDEPIQMYKIKLDTTDVRMWVPTHRAAIDGIRRPIEKNAIPEILQTIEETKAPVKRANWNRRQRRYRELLMSNDPLQIAALLGELASVRAVKSLSFGERQMFERARDLLAAELQTTCEQSDDIVGRLEKALTT